MSDGLGELKWPRLVLQSRFFGPPAHFLTAAAGHETELGPAGGFVNALTTPEILTVRATVLAGQDGNSEREEFACTFVSRWEFFNT